MYTVLDNMYNTCRIAFQLLILYRIGGQGNFWLIWFADCFCKKMKEILHDVNSIVTFYYIIYRVECMWNTG